MGVEERIRYLLRAAARAEGEGDSRVAVALRRMAEEALPMGRDEGATLTGGLRCCPE